MEDETDRLVHLLKTYEIGSIGISTTLLPDGDIKNLIELVTLIKEINDKPPIILGGIRITQYVRALEEEEKAFMQSSLKALNVDFIVDSVYGEEKLPVIISRLKEKLSFDDIPNLYMWKEAKFYRTEKKDEVYQLQEKKINWQLFKGRVGNTVAIRTAISCRFNCKFCTFPILAGKYNNVAVVFLEQALNNIQELGEVELIYFIDDTFNIPSKRFENILKMMIKNKYTFKWYAHLRCQMLDEKTVRLMKESGCIGVVMGLESGSDIMLELMNKHIKVDQYKKGMKWLKQYGIVTLTTLFIGFPGETEATAEATYRFIEEIKPDFYYLWPWYYDRSTPIHDQRKKYDLKGDQLSWSHNSMDAETAIDIVEKIKHKIENSISLEEMNFHLLFRMLGTNRELAQMKSILSKLSKIFIEKNELTRSMTLDSFSREVDVKNRSTTRENQRDMQR